MAWFALGRVVIIAAVAYTAAVLQPLPWGMPINVAFALVLAGLVVAFEGQLRHTAADAHPRRRCSARSSGLALARAIEAGLFWTDSGDRRVEFLHSFLHHRAAVSRA